MTPTSPAHDAPFQRTRRNLLITGHRPGRLPKQPQQLARLELAIEDTVRQIALHASSGGAALRILTGVADGADASAARIAADQSLALDLVAGCPPAALTPGSDLARAERQSYILAAYQQPLPQALVAAADETKLALADAVLLVWDGQPAQGDVGGSVRLMIAAMRQFTPLVWIDASEDGDATVRWLDHRKLGAAAFAALQYDPNNMQVLHALFAAPGALTPQQALAPFWDAATLAELSAPLVDARVDTGTNLTLSGIFHSQFLASFSPWKRKNRPQAVSAYRGAGAFTQAAGWPESAWTWFDRCDRAATHAANKHRDQVVLVELCGALAVFGAVAGAIALAGMDLTWGLFELATLALIGGVVWYNQNRRHNSHATWMTFRPAAEALRMSALLHGLMANLEGLRKANWFNKNGGPVLARPYHWLVTQWLREAGVAQHAAHSLEQRQGANQAALTALLQNQADFHAGAVKKHKHAHHSLHRATGAVYGIVLLTVLLHLYALLDHHSELGHWIHEQRWPLLITAFFPALAAALHGIKTKLQLEQVEQISHAALEALHALQPAVAVCATPMALRALALEAAAIMYAEHDGWSGLMEHQYVSIP